MSILKIERKHNQVVGETEKFRVSVLTTETHIVVEIIQLWMSGAERPIYSSQIPHPNLARLRQNDAILAENVLQITTNNLTEDERTNIQRIINTLFFMLISPPNSSEQVAS